MQQLATPTDPRLSAEPSSFFGKPCVLDGINLALDPGRHTALVGLNGADKTTLLEDQQRLHSGSVLMVGLPFINVVCKRP